jgi:16S rRNA (guanine527-N7)-methyltransferase
MKAQLSKLAQPVDDDAVSRFEALLDELEKWNRKVNLTAIRNRDDMVTAHILDSLVARPLLHGRDILDVGTGPGIYLARQQQQEDHVCPARGRIAGSRQRYCR